ncbi:Cof-type HAD-IIB family hydrolase [Kineosporia succinea]|uniref:Cof subfamily protein (Haloacid dehalogenase superfamily) n=1 Tax=Kineosporia succinea TaxID=84632 RepID=A0ABT9PE53_9ACTN|nr:Cof-type HAD-IIB family hydrolase [Kineosporia succinea]MDP9830445.1 Cof subfamily protein (haloacid dehalogenase superfamily) [Kineosporia succinea]
MSSTAESTPTVLIPGGALDLRLVVADMDGTLLDANGDVPAGFWPLLERMRERGIVFVPASGRQYATLARLFEKAPADTPYVAENGTYLVREGAELGSTTLTRATVVEVIEHLRELARTELDLGVVLCGKRSAYVERTDEPFVGEVRKYYAALEIVDDLLAPDDEILKIAVFDFGDAETGAGPRLDRFREREQVVVSNHHWVDVMAARANKGAAVEQLQDSLGITRDQTVAFGDYLNDLEMLDAATWSFAMANAHPEVLARAAAIAPSNAEQGMLTVLEELLGR